MTDAVSLFSSLSSLIVASIGLHVTPGLVLACQSPQSVAAFDCSVAGSMHAVFIDNLWWLLADVTYPAYIEWTLMNRSSHSFFRKTKEQRKREMGFQARLCFFLFLTFTLMCFAREIPSETEQNVVVNDYAPPGHDPKHEPPHHPPLKLEFISKNENNMPVKDYTPTSGRPTPPLHEPTSLSREMDNSLPPEKGSNINQKG